MIHQVSQNGETGLKRVDVIDPSKTEEGADHSYEKRNAAAMLRRVRNRMLYPE